MKKGFTLLELIIVIIIIGILATLGFTQYTTMVEKSRGAESRSTLGDIRKLAVAYKTEYGNCNSFDAARANLGTATDQTPTVCRPSHYFAYAVTAAGLNGITATATRCNASGKSDGGSFADMTINLMANFTSGTDSWGGNGNW